MYKTIGILAHVDAGKTTLSEQILFRCGATRSLGRVDHGDTILDHDATERRRGITIFADQAVFSYAGNTYTLVDTPGHADFSPEMERVLRVLDCAILVISCVEGVQAHTQIIWDLLSVYRVPTVFFLNKTDRPGADVSRVLAQIRQRLSDDAILFDGGTEPIAEEIAERDDSLLERYLESGYDASFWDPAAGALTMQRHIFPVFTGCALSGDGVERFLAGMDSLVRTQYDPSASLSACVYKVRHDQTGSPVTFLKIRSGTLHARDTIGEEKIHEIRQYQGGRFTSVPSVCAGQLCGVTGLHLPAGTCIGFDDPVGDAKMIPLLCASVQYDPAIRAQTVLDKLRILEAEEPQMAVEWFPDTQRIQIRVMGPIQLEVLAEQCSTRFGLSITFGDSEVLYQETIDAPAYGCGHFEPLRHYAEVHLLLRPLPRGSGVRFTSDCPTDELRLNWQRLIETHVMEKRHRGALCGFPINDIEVVLLAGRAHEKHTEGGDFRQATYRAIRSALFSAESVILEPYYRFSFVVPSECVGRLLSDLQKKAAVYDAPQTEPDGVRVCGRCPAAELMTYSVELSAYTKGRGTLCVRFDGYDRCHDPDDVLRAHPYDSDADVENTADSVFCAHGAGYTVPWNEAAYKMHCAVDSRRINAYTGKKPKEES